MEGTSKREGRSMKTKMGKEIRIKIDNRIDYLERCMLKEMHITSPDIVNEVIRSISKYWSILDDDDIDYIQACEYARDEELTWGHQIPRTYLRGAPNDISDK